MRKVVHGWRYIVAVLGLLFVGCELPDGFIERVPAEDPAPSEITFELPGPDAVLESPIEITAAGEDLAYVDFLVADALISRDRSAPFAWTLDPDSFEAGEYELTVRAYRENETSEMREITIRVSHGEEVPPPPLPPAPLVFDLPDEGATIDEARMLRVTGEGLAHVRFAVDGSTVLDDTQAPFEWVLIPGNFSNGAHAIVVTAFRAAEEEAESVHVVIANPEPVPPSSEGMDKTGKMWAPFLEWTLSNPTHDGNPYDLVATARFVHTASGETRTTPMFYDGDNTWKFRFAGTRTGAWTFTTSSSDSDLNGHSGNVTVEANADPKIKGFLETSGGKFALQVGNSGAREAHAFQVYMNEEEYDVHGGVAPFADANRTLTYLAEARSYGLNTIFLEINNNWFELGAIKSSEHTSENPDPATFRILETMITTAHKEGGRVHLWAWGDEARGWTQVQVGGINGTPDRRLQRYIAARLGPIPGWTMGYGFDLQEWVTEGQVGEWSAQMREHFGWKHLLWARGRSHANLDAVAYSGYGLRSYDAAVSTLASDTSRPHLYEERDTYLRNGSLTTEGTRRGMHRYTMAGGVGGFWGFFAAWRGQPQGPYPSAAQLRTFGEFWRGRFLLDMERANDRTDGSCLKAGNRLIFYREGASSVRLDLSGVGGSRKAVAIDTAKGYAEIDLGTRTASDQTWTAPYASDWMIAVGDFER